MVECNVYISATEINFICMNLSFPNFLLIRKIMIPLLLKQKNLNLPPKFYSVFFINFMIDSENLGKVSWFGLKIKFTGNVKFVGGQKIFLGVPINATLLLAWMPFSFHSFLHFSYFYLEHYSFHFFLHFFHIRQLSPNIRSPAATLTKRHFVYFKEK